MADAAALVFLRASAGTAAHRLPHLSVWLLRCGCDRVLERLAAAGLWLAAAWLALGLLAACAAALPGTPGRISAALCRVLLPRAARRLVAGTAGLGVLLAPATAVASPASPPGLPGGTTAPVIASAHHFPGAPLPPPTWPTSHGPRSSPPAPRLPKSRHSPALPPTAPIPRRPAAGSSPPPATRGAPHAEAIRVRPGDCLWLLAARHLPPSASDAEIAAYWPRWYARNRAVIGAEPDLLRPGELLKVPQRPQAASG